MNPFKSESKALVPRELDIAAAWAWRLLIIAFGVALVAVVLFELRVITVPLYVAILGTTILVPPASFLQRRGFKPALATTTVFLSAAVFIAAVVYLLSAPVADQLADLGPQIRKGVEDVNDWLVTGPLGLDQAQIDKYYDQIVQSAKTNSGTLGSGLAHGATLAAEIATGLVVSIILTFFLTKDGERLFAWWVGRLPQHHRPKADRVGKQAWHTLAGYLRGVAITGLVDAVLIGIALVLIGVPLLLPLVLLTFFGAFLPVVGATLAGLVAVLVALVNGGGGDALLVLLAVFIVQQLEGHILQPVVMSRAVQVHPVVILLALGIGAIIAGILGAFLSVPFVAVMSTVFRELFGEPAVPTEPEIEQAPAT